MAGWRGVLHRSVTQGIIRFNFIPEVGQLHLEEQSVFAVPAGPLRSLWMPDPKVGPARGLDLAIQTERMG